MSHIDHFSYGPITPILAYVMSSVGSMLGLLFTSRARVSQGGARIRWLIGGALSIGGTGIWVMHFIAMMGFDVPGSQIRYNVPLTIVSAVLAIVFVGIGLVVVSFRGERFGWLVAGGVLTGLGVAGMHYLGMFAMNTTVVIGYDPGVVGLSVVIAVVAATVALWFTLRVRGALATSGAALLMGIAVSGMHYTGMFAMSVRSQASAVTLGGAEGVDFLMPLLVVISLLTLGLLLGVMLAPPEHELQADALLLAQLQQRRGGVAPTTPATRVEPQSDRPPSLFDDRRRRG